MRAAAPVVVLCLTFSSVMILFSPMLGYIDIQFVVMTMEQLTQSEMEWLRCLTISRKLIPVLPDRPQVRARDWSKEGG
jgi:hypothetical protein